MKDVLENALLSFRLLTVGGVMIFENYWMQGVARATAAFEEALGDSLKVLHRDKVGTSKQTRTFETNQCQSVYLRGSIR